ncbi:MAG: LysM peptidoglycan-binding domain-containing protein [Acidimicrobiales bacterium]
MATVALAAVAGLADTGRHTVRQGETLAGIARRYGTTTAAIAQTNGIANPNLIIEGTTLVIPDAAASAPAAGGGSAAGTTHTVRPGETLGRIARRYGTTIDAISQANAITDTYVIAIGLQLTIPGASGPGASGAASSGGTTHTVRPGETLGRIARRYGTTVDGIAQANGITNRNVIVIGRHLTIPGAAAAAGPAGIHIVQPGDTLAGVASHYGLAPEALAAANGLAPPFTLYTGNRLYLSAQNSSAAPSLATCPVPGASFFNDYGFPRAGGRFHDGVDLFAARGTPVVAPVGGRLQHLSGPIGGRQFILYGDDGHRYAGSHLDAFGESGRVSAGTVIGYVGDSGNAVGGRTHLHFAVRPNGGPTVNPYPSLHAAC